MAPQAPPLDEIEFDQPTLLYELPGGNLNSNSILWYFMNSPFYDRTANNSALVQQLHNTPDGKGQAILWDRLLFEQELGKRFPAGVNFVVSAEPKAAGEPWVIQRQFKTQDPETGKPVIEVQGTYYTQGTKVFMAPSLLDVVQLRLLSVSTQLQELYQLSKNLSHFSPATGHTYLPPSYELPKATIASRIGSRLGSPSFAATEPADAPPASQSQPAEPGEVTAEFSDGLFLQSLALTNTYYNEFMDENPLQGEPGAFVFTNTYGAVDARNKAQEKLQQQQQQQQQQAAQAAGTSASASATGNIKTEALSAVNSVVATPKTGAAGGATPIAPEALSRKASVVSLPRPGKEKRKKSKGLGSPVTPTAP